MIDEPLGPGVVALAVCAEPGAGDCRTCRRRSGAFTCWGWPVREVDRYRQADGTMVCRRRMAEGGLFPGL